MKRRTVRIATVFQAKSIGVALVTSMLNRLMGSRNGHLHILHKSAAIAAVTAAAAQTVSATQIEYQRHGAQAEPQSAYA